MLLLLLIIVATCLGRSSRPSSGCPLVYRRVKLTCQIASEGFET